MAVTVTTYPDPDATGYVSVAEFKAYCDQRLKAYAGKTDDQIGASINEGSEYMELRFQFVGYRKEKEQSREWPRSEAWDERGDLVEGVPQAVKDACCEYAFRRLNGIALLPDPERDDSGRSLKSKEEKVGPLATKVEYEAASGGYELPVFPSADRILVRRGLVRQAPASGGISVGEVARG